MTFNWRYSQHLPKHHISQSPIHTKAQKNTPDAEQEAEDIRLLLLVQLSDILVGTHRAAEKTQPY